MGAAVTRSILVVGAGEATGGAVARRFAREGYIACITRRNADKLGPHAASIEAAGGRATPLALQARDEAQVIAKFQSIERHGAPLEHHAFNIWATVRRLVRDTTAILFRKVEDIGVYSVFR